MLINGVRQFHIKTVAGVSPPLLAYNVRRGLVREDRQLPLAPNVTLSMVPSILKINPAECSSLGIAEDGVNPQKVYQAIWPLEAKELIDKLEWLVQDRHLDVITRGVVAMIGNPPDVFGDFNIADTILFGATLQGAGLHFDKDRIIELRTITAQYLQHLGYMKRAKAFLEGCALGTIWDGTFGENWWQQSQQNIKAKQIYKEILAGFLGGAIGDLYPQDDEESTVNRFAVLAGLYQRIKRIHDQTIFFEIGRPFLGFPISESPSPQQLMAVRLKLTQVLITERKKTPTLSRDETVISRITQLARIPIGASSTETAAEPDFSWLAELQEFPPGIDREDLLSRCISEAGPVGREQLSLKHRITLAIKIAQKINQMPEGLIAHLLAYEQ